MAKHFKTIIWFNKCLCLVVSVSFLLGCGVHRYRYKKLPPVADGWRQSRAIKSGYLVQKNDTLYSIAWAFGLDYRYLARRNNISSPYKLRYKQRIYIDNTTSAKIKNKRKTQQGSTKSHKSCATTNINPIKGWAWPSFGKIIEPFNNKHGGNKGIDIAGRYGSAILASNEGKVVYSGTGIPSYGKLLIIKHSDDYLSAYAYNSKMLVHEGQVIKTGQKIAAMGRSDSGSVRLHFEIRKVGQPINPLRYLPRKK